jgi:hypothetical protein
MKYTRMVCFLEKDEKWSENLIVLVGNRFPIILTDSLNKFESCILRNDYIVVSILKAKNNLDEMQKMVKKYPQLQFHFLGHQAEDGYTFEEFKILDEENVVSIPYDWEELVLEYTGKIKSVFSKRGISGRLH